MPSGAPSGHAQSDAPALDSIVRGPNSRLRYATQILLLAGSYVLAGRLGFTASAVHPVVSSAWPPSGLALAALLFLGTRFWPAIALGAFVVNAISGIAPLAAASIAVGKKVDRRPDEKANQHWMLERLSYIARHVRRREKNERNRHCVWRNRDRKRARRKKLPATLRRCVTGND